MIELLALVTVLVVSVCEPGPDLTSEWVCSSYKTIPLPDMELCKKNWEYKDMWRRAAAVRGFSYDYIIRLDCSPEYVEFYVKGEYKIIYELNESVP